MITAKCDVCGKDLGQVPIEKFLDANKFIRYGISTNRCFKFRGDGKTACSVECARILGGPTELGIKILPFGMNRG